MSGPPVQVAGHFGEWLQGRLGPVGPLALITLPCPAMTVATTDGAGATPLFSAEQLAAFAEALGLSAPRWSVLARRMPAGAGTGASTATLIALARGAGFDGPPDTLAQACLRVEGATDPLMYPQADRLLWASRQARIIETLPPPPPCEIVGGFRGAPERTDPADTDFPDIADLVEAWRDAAARADLPRLAHLASQSAERCTARRGPDDDPMPALARSLGALGHVRAHTGSARGLIFPPGRVPEHAAARLTEAGLTDILRFEAGAP